MNRLLELPPEQQTPEQKKVFEQLVSNSEEDGEDTEDEPET